MTDKVKANPKLWYSQIRNITGDKRSSYSSNEQNYLLARASVNIKYQFANITMLLPSPQTTEMPVYLHYCPIHAIVNECEVYQHLRRIAKGKFPDDTTPRV